MSDWGNTKELDWNDLHMKRKMTQPVTRWVFSAQFQVTKYLDNHEKIVSIIILILPT